MHVNIVMKKMYDNKFLTLFLILLIVLIFSSVTFAYWVWQSSENDNTKVNFTVTPNFSCSVDGGGDITNDEVILVPSTCTNNKYAIKREVTVNSTITETNMSVSMDLWLDINLIDTGLSNSINFNYALTTSDNSCSEDVVLSGNFNEKKQGDTVLLFNKVFNSSATEKYYLWIWLDAEEISSDTMDQSFNLSLNGQCKSETKYETQSIVNYISTIYNNSSKESVSNDSITYNYASSVSMMNDRLGGVTDGMNDGNIRYYGASPNNYVYFNCNNYDFQTKQNCELWRIIGVFKNVDDGTGQMETRVKIIRDTSLGKYTFDTTPSTVNSGNGANDWSISDLSKMLNPDNDDNQDYNASSQLITLNNSLYWNRTSGNCYVGKSNAVGTCDFSNNGITDASKSMIGSAVYYLGSFGDEEKALMSGTFVSFMERFHAHEMYAYERSEDVNECNDILDEDGKCVRPTKWSGMIGLMYPSDYIYATDFNLCSYDGISFGWSDWSHTTNGFVTDACYANDWLVGSGDEWLISPHNTPIYRSFTLQSGKYVYGAYNWRTYQIRPTLYLKSDVLVKYGNGTIDNPYQLLYND